MVIAIRKKQTTSASRRTTGPSIGIDVGSYLTKVVCFQPKSPQPFTAAFFPTGIVNNTVTDSAEIDAGQLSGIDASVCVEQVPTAKDSKNRRLQDKRPDFSRWSRAQMVSLAARLRGAIGDQNRSATVRISLGMSLCDLRNLQTTAGTGKDVDSIRQQIAEVTGDTRSRSVAILPNSSLSHNIKVLSVPEELVDGIALELDQRKLTPDLVEGSPWSLNRLHHEAKVAASLMLDWGYSQPTLVATGPDGIQYVRRLKQGGIDDLIAPWREQFALSRQDAVRLLHRCIEDDQHTLEEKPEIAEDVREWVRGCCFKLAREVESACEYIAWKHPSINVETLSLVGGGARSNTLVGLLGDIQAVKLQPWYLEQPSVMLDPMYAIAYGLAVGESQ